MELILALASLKCFDMEPAKKYRESNFSHKLDKRVPLDAHPMANMGGHQE